MTANKKRSIIIKILVFLNLFACLFLICAIIAVYIDPSKSWVFAFFGLAYPVLLIINLAFVLLWIILWKKYVFLSLVVILCGWNQLTSFYPFRFGGLNPRTNNSITVISFNIHRLFGNEKTESIPETRSKVTDFLSNHQADILCVQEFFAVGEDYNKTIYRFTRSLELPFYYYKNYKKFWNKTMINAIATFSRYPIVNQGEFRLDGKDFFAIYTDIAIKNDTIRVYNLHLEPFRFGNEEIAFYDNLTSPGSETAPLNKSSRKMFWKLKKAFIARAKEVNMLTEDMRYCPYPILVCGDFNDTPFSYTYRELTRNLNDSFKQAGFGFFGETYAGRLPAFRIDYILFSDFFTPCGYKKFEIDLSDHYPIATILNLNR
jgi:endonuclease/exonuclease/phosphatase family metal-dependent hydrolase